MWDKSKLSKALSNNLIHCNIRDDIELQDVIIDSRNKTNNGIFVAIVGGNNDGHNYLLQAFDNGCAAAIVSKIPEIFKNDDRLILVKDSNESLVDIAKYAREIFKGKIIGVTGSVGKTSIKEMLKDILATQHIVFANFGNLNNHFGLPLSLCNLPEDFEYGIFEMGMNHLGEIEYLSNIAKPDIAIISTVKAAHIGNFNSEQEIALAKSEIFLGQNESGFAIINKDNKYFDFLNSQAKSAKITASNIISFGKNKNSTIALESIKSSNSNSSELSVNISGTKVKYTINTISEAVIKNSLIVISVLKALDKNIADYLEGFNQTKTPKGRGNIININSNNKYITIIDDSYNANLASVISGLKFLSNLKQHQKNSRTVAIIGDMLELGKYEIEEHKAIAQHIKKFKIDKILLVGNLTKHILPELNPETIIGHFDDSENLAGNIQNLVNNNDILLIKGSRGSKMELIINKLTS